MEDVNEEALTMQIRKFLKKVGITSQREIEQAVRDAVASGKLKGDESVQAKCTLTIESLGVTKEIVGDIDLK